MSGDSEQEYFSDGITEDIITALTCSRSFSDIARNSTFIYKGQSVDVRQVAGELHAIYVVEGSIRKAGNRARFTENIDYRCRDYQPGVMRRAMSKLDKYVQKAKELRMANAMIISPSDIYFDIRALLKCRWGCEDFFNQTIKCNTRNTTFQERTEMIKAYQNILLVHSHDGQELSKAVLEIERTAFLDGYYFAFTIRTCKLCKSCAVDLGKSCPTPDRVRPCDQSFGIDVYKTARKQGLPCNVLQSKKDVQNRYGFVLIE